MVEARRTPLTRLRALAAAVAMADADGIEAVSMRSLASALGVVPMALYKHVSNKEDLLDGMVGLVIRGYGRPAPELGWRAAVRAQVLSARATLARHPWARAVIETRSTRTPEVLSYLDTLSGLFMSGGFSADLTHHVMHALGHRVWGFSPEGFQDPNVVSPSSVDQTDPAHLAEARRTYPHIAAIADASGALSGRTCDEDFEFAFALDLLLEAFDRLHRAGWSSA